MSHINSEQQKSRRPVPTDPIPSSAYTEEYYESCGSKESYEMWAKYKGRRLEHEA